MPVYSYIRFSLKRQILGDSLRRQSELAKNYCQRHGLVLDESLTMRDLGVSAFRGKNHDIGALSVFLEACQSRKIPKNSTLIVENLDRVTREDTLDAVGIIASILKAGVTIIQLAPETVYTRSNVAEDLGKLMMLVVSLAQSHQESKKKSQRISEGWQAKRKDLSAAIKQSRPGWVSVAKDGITFFLNNFAKSVKQIFLWYSQGFGAVVITKKLQDEKWPCPARNGKWHIGYVQQILHAESVFGKYQPKKRDAETGKYLPVGEPIDDFYPTVISKELWNKCQLVKAKKPKRGSGRPSPENKSFNLFRGLIWDTNKSSVYMDNRHANRYPVLCNYSGHKEKKAKPETFPYQTLEWCFLEALTELQQHQIEQSETTPEDTTTKLKAEIAELEIAIIETKKALAKRFSQHLLEVIEGYEESKEQMDKELAAETVNQEPLDIEQAKSVIERYRLDPLDETNRSHLTTAIRSLVRKIIIRWQNKSAWLRAIDLNIIFHNGATRSYRLTHKRLAKDAEISFTTLFQKWEEIEPMLWDATPEQKEKLKKNLAGR